MALKKLGAVPCPNCGRPATVGITKEGHGNAVHAYCTICLLTIQVSRKGDLGQKLIAIAMDRSEDSGRKLAIFDFWEYD